MLKNQHNTTAVDQVQGNENVKRLRHEIFTKDSTEDNYSVRL